MSDMLVGNILMLGMLILLLSSSYGLLDGPQKMPYFRQLPCTLHRIQPKLPVQLGDFHTQRTLGRNSFDLTLENGLVKPTVLGSPFLQPNGMSLRPMGQKLNSLIQEYEGSFKVYRLHEGYVLPEGLVVFHEHTDHYSLQTAVPVTLNAFDDALTALLMGLPSQTKEEFLAESKDEDCQDM
jgi:hypothetical protein